MSDGIQTGQAEAAPRRPLVVVVAASLLLLVGSTAGGYLLGRDIARRPLAESQQLVQQLQPQVQQLKAKNADDGNTIISLQRDLKRAQTALHEIRPKQNTYSVTANESLIVGDGHLTIGLIGAPRNDSILLNINGKTDRAVTGDVFNVTPDPATACQVRIQSFDMFQALVNATCTKASPK